MFLLVLHSNSENLIIGELWLFRPKLRIIMNAGYRKIFLSNLLDESAISNQNVTSHYIVFNDGT